VNLKAIFLCNKIQVAVHIWFCMRFSGIGFHTKVFEHAKITIRQKCNGDNFKVM